MEKVKISSLHKQSFIILFLLFGVVAIATSVLSAWTLNERMRSEFISKGETIASSIANISAEILLERDPATIQSIIDEYLKINGTAYVFVRGHTGEIIAHTFVPSVPPIVQDIPISPMPQVRTITIGPHSYFDVSCPILAGVAGAVHVGMDKALIHSYIVNAIIKQQALMFCIFLISLIILFALVGRVSKPLTQLTIYAQRLAAHEFEARVNIRSSDEVGILARSMQSMGQELSTLISGLERAVENATLELQDTLQYMQSIIDNLGDGLLVTDLEGNISRFNPALLRMYGFMDDEDLTGKNVRLMLPPDIASITEAIKDDSQRQLTAEVGLADGSTGKALATSIQRTSTGHSYNRHHAGAVILIRDITAEKEIDRMKTDFISTVSHELRTPLTSVLGFAKIIQKKLETIMLPPLAGMSPKIDKTCIQVADNINIIVSEGERLTELINDVLDISKMEAGKVEWRMQRSDIGEIISQAMASTKSLFEHKELERRIELAADLPPVRIDRARFMQVMINLLSNAVKFTSSGRVLVKSTHENGLIQVCVEDTGSGIAERDSKRIFDRFKQAGDTLTEKPKGTGLGLPICKHIVETHGGQIWVESIVGQGSSFYFTIPAERSKRQSALASSAKPDTSLPPILKTASRPKRTTLAKILVVDDDPSILSYLTQLIGEEGFEVISAVDGVQALSLAGRELPDLITMDLMMPGIDGGTVIARLRQDERTRRIPILVITALHLHHTFGADASLIKPINENELIETIHGLLHGDRMSAKPCLVLTSDGVRPQDDLLMICPGKIVYCRQEEVSRRLGEGFEGTIFVPSFMAKEMDLNTLAGNDRVQVVLLPEPY
ncbi:MAG: ATP-binding protein [Desulfovibrio sp.]|uniref:ATP-binding protein n=1 Tax=Desulfovibrio sp. 7SRBS1 TaxID=3378064 RepID=UPI003B412A5A